MKKFIYPVNKNRNTSLRKDLYDEMKSRSIGKKYGFNYKISTYHEELDYIGSKWKKIQKTHRDIGDIHINFTIKKGQHPDWGQKMITRGFNLFFYEKNDKLYIYHLSNYLNMKRSMDGMLVYKKGIVKKLVDKIELYLIREIHESDETAATLNKKTQYRILQEVDINGEAMESIAVYNADMNWVEEWFGDVGEAIEWVEETGELVISN